MKIRNTIRTLLIIAVILSIIAVSLIIFGPQIDRFRRIYIQRTLMEQIQNGETEIILENVPIVTIEGNEFDEAEPAEITKDRRPTIEVTGYGVIEIPAIELAMPLVKGVDNQSLSAAPGWYPESAEIGTAGNAVILGHRMYGYGEHFNRLDEVKTGDEIIIHLSENEYYVYTVTETEVILPGVLMDKLTEHNDGFRLTLVTCTPTGVGSHRLLVYAELTESSD